MLEARDRINATPGLQPIIATFLLTVGRRMEVLGLDVDDISFDRELIRFRPTEPRRLLTLLGRAGGPLWGGMVLAWLRAVQRDVDVPQ